MPWVCAPSTSKGNGTSSVGSAALSNANMPTCGPLPWVSTSSCSSASGASAPTARTALARWTAASGFSPRCNSAFPPNATTMRTMASSSSERGDHHGLDRVHAVLGLVEHDRLRRLEHLVGDFECIEARLVVEVLTDLRVAVVERRQAVHELHLRVARGLQQVGVHLIWLQYGDAL